MDNYKAIVNHLLDAAELVSPQKKILFEQIVVAGEANGISERLILKNIVSLFHLMIIHQLTK